LDELAAQTAAYMATQHPDFSRLAARISVSNLHKSTDKVFSDVVEKLHKHVHPKTKKPASLIADDVYEVIMYVSRRPRITPKIRKKHHRPPSLLETITWRPPASRETAAGRTRTRSTAPSSTTATSSTTILDLKL